MKIRKTAFILLAIIVLSLAAAPPAQANSAEPPGIVVIVNNPPEDLEISLRLGGSDELRPLHKSQSAWEAQYSFYYDGTEPRNIDAAALVVVSAEYSFEIALPDTVLSSYNNYYTLNLKTQGLTDGMTIMRGVTIVGLRMVLTLLIEGLVFFAFMYRAKRSWIVFLIVNLITQAALNALLYGAAGSLLLLGLIICEIGIFIVEVIAFPLLLREHGKWRAAACVLVMNLLSLFIGGAMIVYLPA